MTSESPESNHDTVSQEAPETTLEYDLQRIHELHDALEDNGARSCSENGFEYYDLDNPEAVANWAVLHGFLLHGTTRRLSTLTPMPAKYTIQETGNRLAVYMTHIPAVAMFYAICGGTENVRQKASVTMNRSDDKITYPLIDLVVSDKKALTDGYVYIFDESQTDDRFDGEFLAYDEQKPLAVMKMKVDSFTYPIQETSSREN